MLVCKQGDIFTSDCKTLVVPTNCMGPMGAGLAKQFRDRFVGLETRHKEMCRHGAICIGRLWLWKGDDTKWILALPTKTDWRLPSNMQYVKTGLDIFVETYQEYNLESVAFPVLGCGLGGLDKEEVIDVMVNKLSDLSIKIELYC